MSFSVILNGCDTTSRLPDYSVREQLGISSTDFVFVFVGNINPNKNQKQVVRAFKLLPPDIKNKTRVIFAGGGDVGDLKDYVVQQDLGDHIKVVGAVPKERIHNYYIASDATILTSLSEGFGLSIVEGYVYGKPTVTFKDLGAFTDICNERTSMGVTDRTDEALARGILDCMNQEWDAEYIKDFSHQFSYNSMCANYLNLFHRILTR